VDYVITALLERFVNISPPRLSFRLSHPSTFYPFEIFMRNSRLNVQKLYAFRSVKQDQPQRLISVICNGSRSIQHSAPSYYATNEQPSGASGDEVESGDIPAQQEPGAMSRRLEDMTERVVQEGGRSAQKHVDEAGFSEELKQRLQARIADSKFKAENPAAFAQINLPVCVSCGSSRSGRLY
jgi:hypothetical protein